MIKSRDLFHKISQGLSTSYSSEEAEALAYRLLSHFTNVDRMDVILNKEVNTSYDFEPCIKRLIKKEPIQYIIGEEEFMGLNFEVNQNVLIPRPETEELVRMIISENNVSDLSILDIGTGSGCIPISLAKSFIDSTVTSVDISQDALKIAQKNATNNGVSIDFIHQNILEDFDLECSFDVIVSNPPYVRELEKELMNVNVLEHEPYLALFVSDHDPLIFYRRIMEIASTFLKKGGKLYFEINEYLGNEMKELASTFDFRSISLKKDFLGKDRFMVLEN